MMRTVKDIAIVLSIWAVVGLLGLCSARLAWLAGVEVADQERARENIAVVRRGFFEGVTTTVFRDNATGREYMHVSHGGVTEVKP
jgi:hypothetical protein